MGTIARRNELPKRKKIMKITFTKHATERMTERKVSSLAVELTLSMSDHKEFRADGMTFFKKIGDKTLVVAVVAKAGNEKIVKTVYWKN